MEKLPNKFEIFPYNPNVLKEKFVSAPIPIFFNGDVEFHVHVKASNIVLEVFIPQLGEGNLDHHVYFVVGNFPYYHQHGGNIFGI